MSYSKYTKEDYVILEKALEDMKKLTSYFKDLIAKLEIESELFYDDDGGILNNIYCLVEGQSSFVVNSYVEDCYIDIAYENLILSIYNGTDEVYIARQFEIWNDSKCYCIGTLSIGEIEYILKNEGE